MKTRFNLHRCVNKLEEATKFLEQAKKNNRRLYWNKHLHGMILEMGTEEVMRAVEYASDRYVEIRTANDFKEMFAHFEDGE